jgi:PIF1 helicase.
MPILEKSVANIIANISYVHCINLSSLIIIDEVSMCPLQVLKTIDRLLRDLCDENDKRKPFGGKAILLCGNFWQILPIILLESRGTLIENCVTSWHEFSYFHKITL